MIKVSLISLGCAKNLVDSEIMVGHLHQAGMAVIPEAEQADVVIVNTCSFIDSSKEESIGHILEVHQNKGMKKRRKEQKLIVAGCMSQRFSKDLSTSLHDEVDAFIGLDQITKVAPIIEGIYAKERGKEEAPANFIEGKSTYIPDYDTPRFRLTPKHFAYIKIAEGCNHPCTFCIIPQIRGRHRSRTVESVVAEARQLVKEGVKEINLISQDTTFFGMDTWEQRPNPAPRWIPPAAPRSPPSSASSTPSRATSGSACSTRTRPTGATSSSRPSPSARRSPATSTSRSSTSATPCSGLMQRETSGDYIRDLLKRIRAGIPGIALRTTFIVGFPGETEADVAELAGFIRETKFERLGVFRYSQEEGTRGAKMPDQILPKVKEARWHTLMGLQRQIAAEVSKSYVGKTLKVLVEEPGVARGEADAPDIDGRVYVPRDLPVGEFVEVTITGYQDYDLLALPKGEKPAAFKVAKQAQ
jgi:ribosomal protein S12 methylthiotransferase